VDFAPSNAGMNEKIHRPKKRYQPKTKKKQNKAVRNSFWVSMTSETPALEIAQRRWLTQEVALVQRGFDGFLGSENCGQFFESALLRFDEEEVYDDDFEGVPEYKEEIVLPARHAEGDIRDEGVVELRDVDAELVR
jgi:hypothetical protein